MSQLKSIRDMYHWKDLTSPLSNSLTALLLLSAAIGCGGDLPDRVQVFPAAGQVLWENKPLEGALIVLHPQRQSAPGALPSRAQSDAEGKFDLTTYEAADGAPVGEYAVTVEYYPLQKQGESYVAGANALPQKYSSPQSTDLRVRITEGKNELAPLVLKR